MPQLRLDKILCDAGLATRSEARRMIADGRTSVNGVVVKTADAKFDPELADVRLDGVPVCAHALRYFMLNKPAGVLSATEDPAQKTVLDLLPPELRRLGLFPVGRLDKDTTGLLILTNDGALCHEATSPKHHVAKVYAFTADSMLGPADADALAAGIVLRDGTACLPARLTLDPEDPSRGTLTISEGKYHQVKRMLAARGAHVLTLKRISMGGLELDPKLGPGEWRELSSAEKDLLIKKVVTE
ncbi:MAG: pseudouridine synthase [Oscillospiraceae bacterium]|jgi:16S rRNA pseudouridine516 synthase